MGVKARIEGGAVRRRCRVHILMRRSEEMESFVKWVTMGVETRAWLTG